MPSSHSTTSFYAPYSPKVSVTAAGNFSLSSNVYDPGNVIYSKSGRFYAQGTSSYYITDGYACHHAGGGTWNVGVDEAPLKVDGQTVSYTNGGTFSIAPGMYGISLGTLYIINNEGELDVTQTKQTTDNYKWNQLPIDNSTNFFAFNPTVESCGKYYTTLRTAFSWKIKNPDHVKAYEVIEIPGQNQVAVLRQFAEDEIVPGGQGVILESDSQNAEINILKPYDITYTKSNPVLYDKYGTRLHCYTGLSNSGDQYDNCTEDGIGYFKVKYTKANTKPIYKLSVNEDGEVGFWTKVAQNEVISGNEAYSYTPCALFPNAKTPVIELDKTEAYTTEGILATITTATSGATILYSLDGGETWTEYAEPVAITQESAGEYTILAKASKAGYIDSDIATATYTFVAGEYSPVTLANLIASGDTEGKYIITDLTAVDVVDDELIICKDDNGYANPDAMPNPIPEGQTWVDYIAQSKASIEKDLDGREGGPDVAVPATYDQSNWIALHLPEGQYVTSVTDWQGRRLSGVKGRLLSATNPEFQLDAMPTPDESATIKPNVYVAASFNGYNHQQGTKAPFIGTEYFFVQPKPMELATIGWAQWDAANEQFVVPANENQPEWNTAGLSGHFGFNGSLLEQEGYASLLQDGHSYLMPALIKYKVGGNSQPVSAPRRAGEVAKEYVAYPLRLVQTTKELNGVITGVTAIGGSRVVAGVDYYNLAGQRSSRPWQGVNIVVTRYSDGTTSTCKQIKN